MTQRPLPGGCGPCERDPRHCLHHGWRVAQGAEGRLAIRFTCAAMALAIEQDATRGFTWKVARGFPPGVFVLEATGRADRLMAAARALGGAVAKAGLGGYLAPGEIAVGVMLAERRAAGRRVPAPGPAAGG